MEGTIPKEPIQKLALYSYVPKGKTIIIPVSIREFGVRDLYLPK